MCKNFISAYILIYQPLEAFPMFTGSALHNSYLNSAKETLHQMSFNGNGYVEKQSAAWKENCAGYWLKELQESMDRCTVHRVKC